MPRDRAEQSSISVLLLALVINARVSDVGIE
jgi:hypothetical protein